MNRKQRRARAAQIQSNDKPRYPQTIYQSEDIDPAVLANAAAMESASDADRD